MERLCLTSFPGADYFDCLLYRKDIMLFAIGVQPLVKHQQTEQVVLSP